MGEIADYMLNGLMCQVCGVWMSDVFEWDEKGDPIKPTDLFDNPPGHPRTCPDCDKDEPRSFDILAQEQVTHKEKP